MSTIPPLSSWGWGLGGSGRGWCWVLDPDCGFLPWVEREGGWSRGGARGRGCSALADGKLPALWESAHWGLVGGMESISMFSSG